MRLLDDQTYETVDRFGLGTAELACSICSTSLADDPALYYVVGTALTEPEEAEPAKARAAELICSGCSRLTREPGGCLVLLSPKGRSGGTSPWSDAGCMHPFLRNSFSESHAGVHLRARQFLSRLHACQICAPAPLLCPRHF